MDDKRHLVLVEGSSVPQIFDHRSLVRGLSRGMFMNLPVCKTTGTPISKESILNLHKTHCLTREILRKHCLQFLLGRL